MTGAVPAKAAGGGGNAAVREVVVLGGGPAGAAAAALLARWGHDVVLLTRPAPPAPGLAESLPPSARKLLAAVGALEAVEAAGFHANGGNTVWWAGGDARVEPFPGPAGVHVERGRLEAVLLGLAREAGVEVRRETAATVGADPPPGEPWSATAGADAVRARWLLDATGRSGVVARRGRRVRERGTETFALLARWRRSARPEPGRADPTHTWTESYEDGWAWAIPLAHDLRCATFMVDPRWTPLQGDGAVEAAYQAHLARAPRIARRLRGWRRTGPVRTCPAGSYHSTELAAPGVLLVGDAGSFIDPLSSFGVKKALASGWLAAVVAHTGLVDPDATGPALELYEAREREVYRSSRALSEPFFREAALAHRHPYWERRAEAAREAGGGSAGAAGGGAAETGESPAGAGGLDPVGAAAGRIGPFATGDLSGPAVAAAWESLRTRDRARLAPAPGARWEPRPTVRGNRVVLEAHLIAPAAPGGVRWIRGVDLLRLARLAADHAEPGDLRAAYARAAGTVPLPDFLAAVAAAVAAGALELGS